MLLNQLYFPGWKILINGQEVPWKAAVGRHREQETVSASPDGRIQLALPQLGVYRIEAWYDGPPGWLARNIAVAATSTALILALWLILKANGGATRGRGTPFEGQCALARPT